MFWSEDKIYIYGESGNDEFTNGKMEITSSNKKLSYPNLDMSTRREESVFVGRRPKLAKSYLQKSPRAIRRSTRWSRRGEARRGLS